MATTYNDNSANTEYFRNRPDIVKIFDDLDEFRQFCKEKFIKFDEANLYKRSSYEWRSYLASKKPKNHRKK